MYKKLFISSILLIIAFSGCSKKINNISKNESYKLLDEITVVAEEKNIEIFNAPSSGMSVNYVNWGNGTGMSPVFTPNYSFGSGNCKSESETYSNEIINNISKFKDLFRIQLVRVKTIFEPTKKLLKITPLKYDCANNHIYVKATLYDVENISKSWNKTNAQETVKQIETLDNKSIIYQNIFILDKTYSAFLLDEFTKDSFDKLGKKDTNVENFYSTVIKDLKKLMNIPKSTNMTVENINKSQAEILVDSSEVKKYYDSLNQATNLLFTILKNNDKENQAKYDILSEFRTKYFSYESIKPKLVEIISKNFTEAELVEINNYNNSEVGKKYRGNFPKILSDMQVTTMSVFEKNRDKFSKMIEQRVSELKNNEKELATVIAKNINREFNVEFAKKESKKGQNKNKTQAEILLDKPIYEDLFATGIKIGMDERIKKTPQLLLVKDILEDFVSKYMNYEDFKPYLIKVLNENFTQQELAQINKFEDTKIGIKYNKQFPKLYEEMKTMYKRILEEHTEDLKKMIDKEINSKKR